MEHIAVQVDVKSVSRPWIKVHHQAGDVEE